jgi:hypothetical protein
MDDFDMDDEANRLTGCICQIFAAQWLAPRFFKKPAFPAKIIKKVI